MTRTKTLFGLWVLFAGVFLLSSCTKDSTGEGGGLAPEAGISSKLVFTSANAVSGELLVYFSEDAVSSVESAVEPVTRSGGVATRSGIMSFDAVLDNLGVTGLRRVFPVDELHEGRARAAGLHRWYLIRFDDSADLDQAAQSMAAIAEVSRVQFNQRLVHVHDGNVAPLLENGVMAQSRAAVNFNDPMLSRQWHYINTGDKSIYSGAKAGADVNCAEAWPLCTGDPRVIVAVVDDCVQWDHPDLAANMWVNPRADDPSTGYVNDVHGYNFVNNTTLTLSTSGSSPSHGTHVAGTIAAVNNNGIGVAGIAGGSNKNDGVKIMSCQVFHNNSGGSSSMSAEAFRYAADNGASILQCSFGYELNPNGQYPVTSDTQYANSASVEKQAADYFMGVQNCDAMSGGLVIFSAGNDAKNTSGYPGAYRDYISVTSISCAYTPARYTNYGPGCNIAAPGGDVYQAYQENGTQASSVLSTVNGSGYGFMQGTSMACPHVSGVAALGLSYALQQGKSFTQSEFTSLLLTSVNDLNQYLTNNNYIGNMGTGYIDAFQVLMNVRGITCIPVPVGSQYTLDVQPFLGSGNLDMRINGVEISAEDMNRLGITSTPTIFANRLLIRCTKPGSAIIKIKLLAGNSNTTGINGMTITKEYALIAREIHSQNGGWL